MTQLKAVRVKHMPIEWLLYTDDGREIGAVAFHMARERWLWSGRSDGPFWNEDFSRSLSTTPKDPIKSREDAVLALIRDARLPDALPPKVWP